MIAAAAARGAAIGAALALMVSNGIDPGLYEIRRKRELDLTAPQRRLVLD